MAIRAAFVAACLFACHTAAAGECGSRMQRAPVQELTHQLQQGIFGLTAYGDALASRPEANSVNHLVQQLIILHERIGRVAQLLEIRDAMRHDGERSFVQFKLSHEASLVRLVSSRARDGVEVFSARRESIGAGPARLRAALAAAEALFAACDSPM